MNWIVALLPFPFLLALLACSSAPEPKAAERPALSKPQTMESKFVANEQGAQEALELKFAPGKHELSARDREDLRKAIARARAHAPLAEVRVVAWADSEYPSTYTKTLPEEQREVLIMRHYGDMSFTGIADATGVSINTALGRMRYALNNMRKMMQEKEMVLR